MTRRSSGRRTIAGVAAVNIVRVMRLSALRSRLRALPPERLDLLLGALVLVDGIAEVLVLSHLKGPRVLLGLGLAAAVATAVALRRRMPVTAIVLGWSSMVGADLVGPELTDNVAGPWFATLFVTFTAGYVLDGRRLWTAAALASVLTVVGALVDADSNDPGDFVFGIGLGVGGPMLVGQLVRNRTRLNEALHEKALKIEGERARAAEVAALEERTRIAGELHDVVAHALSAMTVQAAAARRLAERDPERAREAFGRAEVTGREALTELRRLLGVLRKADEELALAPQPSLAHVADLVRRAAAAGLPTGLELGGEPRALPAGVDLTAYRVVQEALATARDTGAAGHAEVAIRYNDGDVVVEVTDDGARSGRRLLGMRERVAVYGGELTAAPSESGGWRVAARLPLEAAS
jgi:signal transduction histidine kinase